MTFEEFWEGVPCDPEDTPDERAYVRRIAEASWNAELKSRWRPIDADAKDGREIYVWQPGWDGTGPLIRTAWAGLFDEGFWMNSYLNGSAPPGFSPTHWMPLPEPPEEGE